MNDIKVGDVVELKSGGPRMTVSKIGLWNNVQEATCDWFEGTANKTGHFPVTSLKHSKET